MGAKIALIKTCYESEGDRILPLCYSLFQLSPSAIRKFVLLDMKTNPNFCNLLFNIPEKQP